MSDALAFAVITCLVAILLSRGLRHQLTVH
jgi:hypothetical protein